MAIAQGGLTIKLMTVGLLTITAAHSYWMWLAKHRQSALSTQPMRPPTVPRALLSLLGPAWAREASPRRSDAGRGLRLRLPCSQKALAPGSGCSLDFLPLLARSEKKFPWQNGISVSDLKVLLPGSKIREHQRRREE